MRVRQPDGDDDPNLMDGDGHGGCEHGYCWRISILAEMRFYCDSHRLLLDNAGQEAHYGWTSVDVVEKMVMEQDGVQVDLFR